VFKDRHTNRCYVMFERGASITVAEPTPCQR
jgi:hypothetical protein